MSKVLLVEPDKMLRHALSSALFPEFEIRAVPRFPEAAPIDIDVVLVDMAALQELEPKSLSAVSSLAEWQLPLVWIEGAKALEPAVKRCIRLSWPVTKDALRGALAQCLNGGSEAKVGLAASAISKTQSRRKEKTEPMAANDGDRFIELVDVVEEPSVS